MLALLCALIPALTLQEDPPPVGLKHVPLELLDGGVLAELEGELTRLHQRLRPSLLSVRFPIHVQMEGAEPVLGQILLSGVLLDRRGYFVSPAVPAPAGPPTVIVADGRRVTAHSVAKDSHCGLELFLAPDLNFRPAPLGSSRSLGVGSFLVILGNPFGLGPSMDLGLLSGLNRSLQESHGLIQITGTVNPGDGGGLVADRRGRIVGILRTSLREAGCPANDPRREALTRAERIGFAIPIEDVLDAFAQPLGLSSGPRPRLGVIVDYRAVPGETGKLWIKHTLPGTPADFAGLLPGDQLLEVGGSPLSDFASLRNAVATAGSPCGVVLQRQGEVIRLEIEFLSGPPSSPR